MGSQLDILKLKIQKWARILNFKIEKYKKLRGSYIKGEKRGLYFKNGK